MYKTITLNDGKSTVIDEHDVCLFKKYKWYVNNRHNYVVGKKTINGKKTALRLHRLIMNCPSGLEVDHINGNRLDNRKENLRICTLKENRASRLKKKNSRSQFKGVSKNGNGWRALIAGEGKGKSIDLGTYKNEHFAALMYDFWAIYKYKNFAKTNFKVVSHN